MDSGVSKIRIHVTRESDVAEAVQQARLMAAGLGFPTVHIHCIATAASELAVNLLMHAGSGIFEVAPLDKRLGLELVAADRGPGIADIDRVMRERYSAADGVSYGLPGVKRLMDELHIDSRPGDGTRIKARKWL